MLWANGWLSMMVYSLRARDNNRDGAASTRTCARVKNRVEKNIWCEPGTHANGERNSENDKKTMLNHDFMQVFY